MKKLLPTCSPHTAVAYARYSSAGQRDVSIDQQLRDIHAFADREGYTIVHEYADHARSGFKNLSARVEFQAMISAAMTGAFDTILCWKVDRFGRNRADSATFKDQLEKLGVSVVYVMEPIPDGAAGCLSVGMLEVLAEWYSRNLSENVTRGMRDNATKSLYNGTKVLGYTCGADHHYEIVPEEASTVRYIFSRYLAGYSAAVICADLNAKGLRSSRGYKFSPQNLLRIISNERYCGVYIWGEIRNPGGMPAIISRSDWEAAQRMKNKTARHVEQRTVDFLLTGKAFCGHCGRSMIGDSGTSRSGTTHYYYTCQGHKSRTGCAKKNVRKDALEDLVIDFIMNNCFTPDELNHMIDIVMDEMRERKKKSPLQSEKAALAEVTKKIANINQAIAAGVYSKSTVEMLETLEEDAEDLRKDIAFLEYTETQLLDRDRVEFFLNKFIDLNRNDPDDRRKLIHYFLNSVYVYDDHLKIFVNFTESSTIVPFDSLPDDPPGSDNITSGVLYRTHPNTTVIFYRIRV